MDNDLISRAAARDVINTWGRHENEDIRMDLLHNDLNALSAVDAEPVRHGRWIPTVIYMNTPDYYACSVCGHEIAEEFTSAIPVPYVYKFCPNCGAKMDGGGDDATD